MLLPTITSRTYTAPLSAPHLSSILMIGSLARARRGSPRSQPTVALRRPDVMGAVSWRVPIPVAASQRANVARCGSPGGRQGCVAGGRSRHADQGVGQRPDVFGDLAVALIS